MGSILTGMSPAELRITQKGNAYVGDTVHAVGYRVGWTTTTVSRTCIRIYPTGNMTGKGILCANETRDLVSLPGDSGGPWFMQLDTGTNVDVQLIGVTHGHNDTNSYFSNISSIEQELGALKVCSAPYDC